MHRLVTATTARNKGDFARNRRIRAIDKIRVVMDFDQVGVSGRHALQLFQDNVLYRVNQLFHSPAPFFDTNFTNE
jgi:hypothetical protein